MAVRECGSCIACCIFLLQDSEPGRVDLEACEHVNLKGPLSFTGDSDCNNCKVYEQRPEDCRAFKCDYLLGLEDERPDISRSKWARQVQGKGVAPGSVPKFFGRKT